MAREMTDEMLPEAECPGRAVTVLDVSLETRERGLGMNSSVSEKPTLARFADFGGCGASSMGKLKDAEACLISFSDLADGMKCVCSGPSTVMGKMKSSFRSKLAGVDGALFPLKASGLLFGGGNMIDDRSWLEIAPDRLCACPRRRAAADGGAKPGDVRPFSDFVGLVLKTVIASPPRTLPPTNSLPPRLCPCPAGRDGMVLGDSGDIGDSGGLRRMWLASSAEGGPIGKEKAGKADG